MNYTYIEPEIFIKALNQEFKHYCMYFNYIRYLQQDYNVQYFHCHNKNDHQEIFTIRYTNDIFPIIKISGRWREGLESYEKIAISIMEDVLNNTL